MNTFQLYSQYYDLLYADKATIEECSYVENLINSNANTGKRWLEFGAGSGRHGKVFTKMGIDWSGIELSPEMAQKGISLGLDIKVGDIKSFKFGSKKFDAILSLFHVISYLHQTKDVIDTFKNAFDHLAPGGLFLFDVWYTPAVYNQLPENRIKYASNDLIEIKRKATPTINWNKNTVNVSYEIAIKDKKTNRLSLIKEDHLMRHFSLPEIEFFAELVGFELVLSEEWLTGKHPGKESWGVVFLLKRSE